MKNWLVVADVQYFEVFLACITFCLLSLPHMAYPSLPIGFIYDIMWNACPSVSTGQGYNHVLKVSRSGSHS